VALPLDHTPPPSDHERFALEDEPSSELGPPPRVTAPRHTAQAVPPAASGMTAPLAGSLAISETPPPPVHAPVHVQAHGGSPQTMNPTAPLGPVTTPHMAPLGPMGKRTAVTAPSGPVATTVPDGVHALRMLLTQRFDVDNVEPWLIRHPERVRQAQAAIDAGLSELAAAGLLDRSLDPAAVRSAALAEVVGFGAIDALVEDQAVREIVVETPRRIVADRGNGPEPIPGAFSSSSALLTCARRLAARAGKDLNGGPVLAATLPDGSHLTVVQPPVAVRGPIVEVRRRGSPVIAEDLVDRGVMSVEMLDVLRAAVAARRTVLVGGPAGSGVTTVLGALASLFHESERIITVEQTPDLAIEGGSVLALSTSSGSGLAFEEVLDQACRLHADRLVVDDVRGAEAFHVLSTVSSRFTGSLVGVHTSSDRNPLAYIEMLARTGTRGSDQAVALLIAAAIHLTVQVTKDEQGGRRVISISEVTGARGQNLQSQELFAFDGTEFKSTGKVASFL
jgi:pilus assembly protein CpaF